MVSIEGCGPQKAARTHPWAVGDIDQLVLLLLLLGRQLRLFLAPFLLLFCLALDPPPSLTLGLGLLRGRRGRLLDRSGSWSGSGLVLLVAARLFSLAVVLVLVLLRLIFILLILCRLGCASGLEVESLDERLEVLQESSLAEECAV